MTTKPGNESQTKNTGIQNALMFRDKWNLSIKTTFDRKTNDDIKRSKKRRA